jgi:hypothetical protein
MDIVMDYVNGSMIIMGMIPMLLGMIPDMIHWGSINPDISTWWW